MPLYQNGQGSDDTAAVMATISKQNGLDVSALRPNYFGLIGEDIATGFGVALTHRAMAEKIPEDLITKYIGSPAQLYSWVSGCIIIWSFERPLDRDDQRLDLLRQFCSDRFSAHTWLDGLPDLTGLVRVNETDSQIDLDSPDFREWLAHPFAEPPQEPNREPSGEPPFGESHPTSKPQRPRQGRWKSKGKSKGIRDSRAIKTGHGYWYRSPIDAAVDPKLADGDYRFLSVLMIYCGRDEQGRAKDHCWPSEETLRRHIVPTGSKDVVSIKTVQRRIASLVKAGYVEVIRPDELASDGYTHSTPGNTYRVLVTLAD